MASGSTYVLKIQKNDKGAVLNDPDVDPNEVATVKRLADRLGFHMGRVIVVAHQSDGWIAAYSTMASTDWPHVFGKPLAFGDIVRSLRLMIEAFEPRSPNTVEDKAVRDLAERLVAWDEVIDYVFVAHRENGFEITVVSEDCALIDEWPAMPFANAVDALNSSMPESYEVDDTYYGTGREYGRH